MRLWRVRPIQVKTAAAVGLAAVLGMASLAAASPGTPAPSESTVEPAPDQAKVDPVPADPETDVTDGSDTATPPADDQPDADTAEPDGTDTEAPPVVAPETCLTHGQRVSAIAHSTPPGPGHGAAVSAAAHDHTGECAHADDDTDDPADDASDDVAEPPAALHAPPASVGPEDHGPPRQDTRGSEDTEGSQGSDNAPGHKKG